MIHCAQCVDCLLCAAPRGGYTSDGKTFDTESDPQSAVKMTSMGLCGGLRKTLKIFIGRRGKVIVLF